MLSETEVPKETEESQDQVSLQSFVVPDKLMS